MNRKRCLGITQKGQKCEKIVTIGKYCYLHQDQASISKDIFENMFNSYFKIFSSNEYMISFKAKKKLLKRLNKIYLEIVKNLNKDKTISNIKKAITNKYKNKEIVDFLTEEFDNKCKFDLIETDEFPKASLIFLSYIFILLIDLYLVVAGEGSEWNQITRKEDYIDFDEEKSAIEKHDIKRAFKADLSEEIKRYHSSEESE